MRRMNARNSNACSKAQRCPLGAEPLKYWSALLSLRSRGGKRKQEGAGRGSFQHQYRPWATVWGWEHRFSSNISRLERVVEKNYSAYASIATAAHTHRAQYFDALRKAAKIQLEGCPQFVSVIL